MVDLSEENRLGLLISIPVYFACLACCAVWAHFKEERLAQGGTGSVADKLSAHYLGGRTFGPLITGGTVFASLFSGYAVVGIPNEAFRYGWTALRWIPQAAGFSAGVAGAGVRLRKASLVRNHQTSVDFMTDRYQSQLLRYTIVLLKILPSLIFLAAQVIALQQTINSIFGLDPDTSYTVISVMFLILLFEWGGGLSSVAITDVIQGFVMIISFTCLAVVVKMQFGGWVDLDPNLYPRKDFYQTPGAEEQVEILQFSVINISIFTLPTMMQRNYAARDLKSLKVGWLSLIFGSWAIIFVSIFLGTVGVQMLAGEPTPVSPFSAIVEEIMDLGGFPRVVGALVFTASIAAIMSTADSLTIAISQLVTAEIFYPLRPQASPNKVAWFGRFVSLITIIIGLLIGIFWKDGITALASIHFPMTLQAFFPFVVGLFANAKYDYHPWCLSAGAISGLLFVVIFYFTYLYLNEASRPIDPGFGGLLLNILVASFLEFVVRRKILLPRRTDSDDKNDKTIVFPDRPKWDRARVERFGEKPLKPQLLKKMMVGIDEPFKNWWYATLLFLTLALTTPLVAEGEPAIAEDGSFESEPATVRGLPWWAFKMIILAIIPFLLVTITILRMPNSFPMDEKKIAKEGIEPELVEMTRKEIGFRLSYDAKNDLVARRRSAIKQEMDALGISTEKLPLAVESDASDPEKSNRLSLLVSGKASAPMPPIDEENSSDGEEIDRT